MADLRISQLPSGTVPMAGSELLALVQSGETRQTPVTNFRHGMGFSSVISATTTALTFALHNNRVVILNTGASLSIDWAATGDGFSCVVINNTASDITPTMTNFTLTTITNYAGGTKIATGGLALLLASTPDSGTTKRLRASGDVVY
jgi:hypothetical protein